MNRLWVHITVGFAFLTLAAIFALLAHSWIQVPPVLLALGLALVGLGLAIFTRRALAPLEAITDVVEDIADGNIKQHPLTQSGGYEVERLRVATNRMVARFNALSAQARDLADGKIGGVDVEKTVLHTQRLADADDAIPADAGDLESVFMELINQRRRLSIQARMISDDRLDSPLLDQRVPGELGETFAQMVQNLRTIARRAHDITSGDLTTTVEGEGQLTTAFNQMVDWLRGLVEQISVTAMHISTAGEQILAVLREQESAANHQASSVEETQRTMETLLASAKKIAENAQHVFKSAEKTQASNRTVADKITDLRSHTERISEILEGIKRIADRSDLLALNASLEGMRAGEAGKGFTLVAAEMRRLAEHIKESVADIKALVTDIGASSLTTESATAEGTRLSENTTDNALKITLITQQQKSGTEQVTQSMDDLSELINQDVAGTRQVTMAAGELVTLAEGLRDLVDTFQVMPYPEKSGVYRSLAERRRRSSSGFRAALAAQGSSAASSGPHKEAGLRLSSLAEAAQSLNYLDNYVSDRQESSEIIRNKANKDRNAIKNTPDSDALPVEQPTIEFSTHLPEEEQREVMRGLLDSSSAVEEDEEPSSIEEDLDALERELGQEERGEADAEVTKDP